MRAVTLAVAVLIAILIVAVQAPWLPIFLLLWFGCPHVNTLSGSCGDYTLEFILVRVLVVAGAALVVGLAVRLCKEKRSSKP